jgi:hypothetical protein
VVTALGIAVFGALFVWQSVLHAGMGLSFADDAYFALAAKSLALGTGYGVANSNGTFLPFDASLTTGAPLVVPLALAIKLLGPIDQVPGLVALIVFLLQLVAADVLVSRRVGAQAGVTLAAAMLAMLVVGFRNQWLFGIFVGEPVAFGFVLLAIVRLATVRTRSGALVAGLCAGLAVMTKLIAVFPVAALALSWAVIEWRSRRIDDGGRLGQRLLALFTGLIGPNLLFELIRLVSLGAPAYIRSWRDILAQTASLGTVARTPFDLPGLIVTALERSYIALPVLVTMVIALLALLRWGAGSPGSHPDWQRLAALALFAAVGSWLYAFVRGTVYDRYLFVGVALTYAMVAFIVLGLNRRARPIWLATLVLAAAVFDPAVLAKPYLHSNVDVHAERVAVVSALSSEPELPYAANWWPSIQQFQYLMPEGGTWAYGRAVARFADRPFVALIDAHFAGASTDFVRSVRATCTPLTPSAQRLAAFDCGEPFWASYLPTAGLSMVIPGSVSGELSDAATRCSIEYFGSGPPDQRPLVVHESEVVGFYGWAIDAHERRPPSAVALAFVAASGGRWYAATRPQDRPDVARAYNDPALTAAGFEAGVRFGSQPPGQYQLDILLRLGNQLESCATGVEVVVD